MPTLEEQDRLEEAGEEVIWFEPNRCSKFLNVLKCYFSHPEFEVIIEKPGKKTVFVNCAMERPEATEEGEDEPDPFEIFSISVIYMYKNIENQLIKFRLAKKQTSLPMY